MVIMRSSEGIKLDNAFKKVVFPEPVPPLTKILYFASTHLLRKSAASPEMAPQSMRSPKLITFSGNFRIFTMGPFRAIGASTIFTREPSSSLASQMGFAESTVRFTRYTILWMISSSSFLSLKHFPVSDRWPSFSIKICSGPLIIISVMLLSSRSGCRIPSFLMELNT